MDIMKSEGATDKRERREMRAKVEAWRVKFERARNAYAGELAKIEEREQIYRGRSEISPIFEGDRVKRTPHMRNVVAELIEAQVQSYFPMPKVSAMCEEDEAAAKMIEDMLRAETDRMPMEDINDMMERLVPVQGGAGYLIEWDNTARQGHKGGAGAIRITYLHPRQIIPQDGIYTGEEDMDYIFLILPQSREYIRRRYGVSVEDEGEEFPEVKGSEEGADTSDSADDMVSQVVAYFRAEGGTIGRASWVGDTPLEYSEDYLARRLSHCKKCGRAVLPGEECSCGGRGTVEAIEEYEERYTPPMRSDGTIVGEEVSIGGVYRIPWYVPDRYPIIMQKNIADFGRFLGASDVDRIASQQNVINRLEAMIIEKLARAGSLVTLPKDARISVEGGENMKVVRLQNPQDVSYIGVYTLEGDATQDRLRLSETYEEMRQQIGITDAYQGRNDKSAKSGVAKEFAANQSAGRLESKSICKASAYGKLYEAMFKFALAYTDEPVPVPFRDSTGRIGYKMFNRFDFLEVDERGEYVWNDNFIFSCDSASGLSQNREAMWQEIRQNFTSGAYGNPAELETLEIFWRKMDEQHYPGAADMARHITEKREEALAREAMAALPDGGAGMIPGEGDGMNAASAALI